MSKDLQSAYNIIADDYLRKKENPWRDFMRFAELEGLDDSSIAIDVGAGNGRNLHVVNATMAVALDLSYELLKGYVGPEQGQRVAGALPSLPFRRGSSEVSLCIAVLHHFRSSDKAVKALEEIKRIGQINSEVLLSVWRRWRKGHREKIFEAIKEGRDTDKLINHERPWYNSRREIMTKRFYHYYSFKELYYQINQVGITIESVEYLGGRHDDANIFVKLSIQS